MPKIFMRRGDSRKKSPSATSSLARARGPLLSRADLPCSFEKRGRRRSEQLGLSSELRLHRGSSLKSSLAKGFVSEDKDKEPFPFSNKGTDRGTKAENDIFSKRASKEELKSRPRIWPKAKSFGLFGRARLESDWGRSEVQSFQSTPEQRSRGRAAEPKQAQERETSVLDGARVETESEREVLLLQNLSQRNDDYLAALRRPFKTKELEQNFELYMESMQNVVGAFFPMSETKNIFSFRKRVEEPIFLATQKRTVIFDFQKPKPRAGKGLREAARLEPRGPHFFRRKKIKFKSQERKSLLPESPRQKNGSRAKAEHAQRRGTGQRESRGKLSGKGGPRAEPQAFLSLAQREEKGSFRKEDLASEPQCKWLSVSTTRADAQRLFYLDPRRWRYSPREEDPRGKLRGAAEGQRGAREGGGDSCLHEVLVKLWWEEYIPVDLYSGLGARNK